MNLAQPLAELELSTRLAGALRTKGIRTVGELTALSDRDLLRIERLGRKSLTELKEVLAQLGASPTINRMCDDDRELLMEAEGPARWIYRACIERRTDSNAEPLTGAQRNAVRMFVMATVVALEAFGDLHPIDVESAVNCMVDQL